VKSLLRGKCKENARLCGDALRKSADRVSDTKNTLCPATLLAIFLLASISTGVSRLCTEKQFYFPDFITAQTLDF
jgi:hypothetical protein